MEPAESPSVEQVSAQKDPPVWTYPTRFCRICREDVPPTVTMYPPGLPMHFQTPVVEYKNDDEYGRLIKPCMCRGSLRYIHELCLLRSRTENTRSGSMWKCHECGHQFNFKKLTAQRVLSSRISVTVLTALVMIIMVFILGFIADPIINIYLDPYDSLTGRESIWDELEIRSSEQGPLTAWSQHFAKGFISMGLVGFLKTLLMNPFQFLNIRWGGSTFSSTSTRSTTGRDRATNISWIAILIGICSAFVIFYKWVAVIVQRSLQRIGNNIVDTQLPGDDDDLKPPPGWTYQTKDTPPSAESPASESAEPRQTDALYSTPIDSNLTANQIVNIIAPDLSANAQAQANTSKEKQQKSSSTSPSNAGEPLMSGSWVAVDNASADDSEGLANVHRQGWTFSNL